MSGKTIQANKIILNPEDYIKQNTKTIGSSEALKKYTPLIRALYQTRICYHCGQDYKAIDNYQRYGCWKHPSKKQGFCCNEVDTLGCVRTMHVSTKESKIYIIDANVPLKIPRDFYDAQLVEVNETMIVKKTDSFVYFASNEDFIGIFIRNNSRGILPKILTKKK